MVAAALLAAALPASAGAAAPRPKVRPGPAGAAFYTPPSPLPGRAHGDVIWARRLTGRAALNGARGNELLLYRSRGVAGKAVAVSGTLALPKGRPPKGGWPVIAYGHGTTGAADVCAPSRDGADPPTEGLIDYVDPLLGRWLKAGYAVVATDYEGLGTPGAHPFLVGRSEGASVLDAVLAARKLEPRLSRTVVLAGHSQGGHAVLWAASLAPRWTPRLRIRGTVAFAPASHIADQARLTRALTNPGGGLSAFAALIFRGADTARPDLNLSSMLSDQARALYPQTLTTCLPELGQPSSFGGLAPAAIFRPEADLNVLAGVLAQSDPEHLRIRTPVRIEQGTADATAFKIFTDQLVQEYARRHVNVVYKTYKGVSHGGVVTAAAGDATRWIRSRVR